LYNIYRSDFKWEVKNMKLFSVPLKFDNFINERNKNFRVEETYGLRNNSCLNLKTEGINESY